MTEQVESGVKQQVLKWLHEGMSLSECARRLHISRQALTKWVKESGTPLPPIKRGRKQALSDAQKTALAKMLAAGPAAHGFRTSAWTRTQVQSVLRRTFGIQLSLSSISSLMATCANVGEDGVRVRQVEVIPAHITPPLDIYPRHDSDLGLFTLLAEQLPIVVVRYDRELRRTYVNGMWCRITGRRPQEVLGQSVHDVPVRGVLDSHLYVEMLTRVARSGVSEKIHLSVDGHASQVLYCLAHHDKQGSFDEVICISFQQDAGEVVAVPTGASRHQGQPQVWAINAEPVPVDTQEALASLAQSFQAWAEDCDLCVLRLHPDMKLAYANALASKALGIAPSAWGQTLMQLFPDCRFMLLEQAMHQVAEIMQPHVFEMPMTLASGGRMLKRVHVVPEHDRQGVLRGFLVVCRDLYSLSHPALMHSALACVHQTVFEETSDCVISLDANGRILQGNASAEQALGLSFKHLRGCTIASTPQLAMFQPLDEAVQRAFAQNERQSLVLPCQQADGSMRAIEWHVMPCVWNQHVASVVALGRLCNA